MIQIISFSPQYLSDFKRLNLEWIEKLFVVEPHDLEQLDHAEQHIIEPGGMIFFALVNGTLAGTCAIIKESEHVWEMAKMGVSDQFKGLGLGFELSKAAIDFAQKNGGKTVYLESNQKLTPALTLYKKLGFVEVPIGNTPFARADYKAVLELYS